MTFNLVVSNAMARAMFIHFKKPGDWELVENFYQAEQFELDLLAPALSVSDQILSSKRRATNQGSQDLIALFFQAPCLNKVRTELLAREAKIRQALSANFSHRLKGHWLEYPTKQDLAA